jgi:hypothetical protein
MSFSLRTAGFCIAIGCVFLSQLFYHVYADDLEGGPVKTNPVRLVSRQTPVESSEKHLLQYKFKEGEVIKTQVTHLAQTLAKIEDNEQPSSSRTVSTKTWKIIGVDAEGAITFEHSVQNVDASQQVGVQDEVRYNSTDKAEVPVQFKEVDAKVDQVISTITMKPNGSVVTRTTEDKYARLNIGEIAVQFPDEAVGVEDQWETTREIYVRREGRGHQRILVREVFTLKKASAGVAVIDVRNEPLTPIHSPEIESQVMQQMNNGTLRFDMDAGRLLSKEVEWNSTVIGFSGAGSRLEYSARLEEKLL